MLKEILNTDNTEFEQYLEEKRNADIEEQKLAAALLIQKMDKIDTQSGYLAVERRLKKKTRLTKIYQTTYKVAAILLLPVLFLSVWYHFINDQTPESLSTQHVVNCPVGIKTHLALPDGSMVWLNSGTTIKYQVPFISKSRNIELNGEAYFSVQENRVPFVVRSNDTRIKVYGTEFNVKNYPGDHKIEVALKEGSIGFSASGSEKETHLRPNDYLVFSEEDQSIQTINKNIGKHIAWRQNRLVFDETPLAEMALMLERWYGIQVSVAGEDILNYKFTATFENEPLLQVIELLELSSPITIEYIPSKIDENSNIINKAKILIRKK